MVFFTILSWITFFWWCLLIIVFLLFLQGLIGELAYIRDGSVNDVAQRSVIPVPSHIQELCFVWENSGQKSVSRTSHILCVFLCNCFVGMVDYSVLFLISRWSMWLQWGVVMLGLDTLQWAWMFQARVSSRKEPRLSACSLPAPLSRLSKLRWAWR